MSAMAKSPFRFFVASTVTLLEAFTTATGAFLVNRITQSTVTLLTRESYRTGLPSPLTGATHIAFAKGLQQEASWNRPA